ncbi:MAG: hypothetical protein QM642_08485 [Edaphocola sp.]
MKNKFGQMPKVLFCLLCILLVCATLAIPRMANAQYQNNGYDNGQYNNQDYDNGQYYNDQDANYNQYADQYDDQYADYGDYQQFYDDLAPYGQWLSDPQYGYVWVPNVAPGFRPYYSAGRWVMTQYGNTWVSDYPWGWAVFHYGRWAYSDFYGWIWIPGRTWGPAWVNWRQGGGYCGWAPLGPGISIGMSFGNNFNIPLDWWTFIPFGNIYANNWQRYYMPRRTVNIFNNTTIINNTCRDNRSRNTYISGPRRSDIEGYTHQRVPVYNVNSSGSAGPTQLSGGTLNVYRPDISNRAAGTAVAPPNVRALNSSTVSNTGGGKVPVARNNAVVPSNQTNNGNQPARNNQYNRQAVQPNGAQQQAAQQQRVQQVRQQQQRVQQAQQQQAAQQQRVQQVQQRVQQAQQQRQQQQQKAQQTIAPRAAPQNSAQKVAPR